MTCRKPSRRGVLALLRRSPGRALGDGRCNLVQLSSRVMPASDRDPEGNMVSREGDEVEDAAESWEARTIRGLEVKFAARLRLFLDRSM